VRSIIFLLFAVGSFGCGQAQVSASWTEAEVVAGGRALWIHPPLPTAIIHAEIVNRTDSTVVFFLGGRVESNMVHGATADEPGRFLLIGPDTTLSMMARRRHGKGHDAYGGDAWAIPPGEQFSLELIADGRWTRYPPPPPDLRPRFLPTDSASWARFYERALRLGRLVYIRDYISDESPDTLDIPQSPSVRVHFRTPDQPSVLG